MRSYFSCSAEMPDNTFPPNSEHGKRKYLIFVILGSSAFDSMCLIEFAMLMSMDYRISAQVLMLIF